MQHLRSRAYLVVVAIAAFAVVGSACAPASGPGQLPVAYSTAVGLAQIAPESPPPGANNFACRPSAKHPRPVVLVNGTFANQRNNWNALSPLLWNEGYCVFTFNYGGPPALGIAYGLGDIAVSAGQLSAFVDRVRSATGAAKVDLVGHSQGGLMPHVYLKDLGGDQYVQNFVGLAPSTNGTTMFGLATIAAMLGLDDIAAIVCASCSQQIAGSSFLVGLHNGGVTRSGVSYTVISTKFDEIVTPWQTGFLPSAPNVKNIALQDICPLDFSAHIGMAFSPNALQLVLRALDPSHAMAACRIVPTLN